MKEFFIKLIKTWFFNIIGVAIFFKSSFYICEHNDIPILHEAALVILICIAIYFIRVDYLKRTDEDIADAAISLFLYAVKRKQGTIEENEAGEKLLKDSPFGESVKKFIDIEK